MVEASIAGNGGFWAPLTAADYDGQGLTSEQVARMVGGSTPHPGATLTEPAVLARPLGELPATYIKCLLLKGAPAGTRGCPPRVGPDESFGSEARPWQR